MGIILSYENDQENSDLLFEESEREISIFHTEEYSALLKGLTDESHSFKDKQEEKSDIFSEGPLVR